VFVSPQNRVASVSELPAVVIAFARLNPTAPVANGDSLVGWRAVATGLRTSYRLQERDLGGGCAGYTRSFSAGHGE